MAGRRLGEITYWRLSLRESDPKTRLMHAAEIAQDVLEYSVIVSGGSNFDRRGLKERVEQLIDEWSGDHPYLRSFGAEG